MKNIFLIIIYLLFFNINGMERQEHETIKIEKQDQELIASELDEVLALHGIILLSSSPEKKEIKKKTDNELLSHYQQEFGIKRNIIDLTEFRENKKRKCVTFSPHVAIWPDAGSKKINQ